MSSREYHKNCYNKEAFSQPIYIFAFFSKPSFSIRRLSGKETNKIRSHGALRVKDRPQMNDFTQALATMKKGDMLLRN
jgi:hypothetical protein